VVTPVAVTLLTAALGWRSSFVLIGSAGFVWVAAWLVLVPGEYRRLLSRRDRTESRDHDSIQTNLFEPGSTGRVTSAFGVVLIAAVLVAAAAFRYDYGPAAIWLGIAVLMIGPLIVAAVLPPDHLQGAAWTAGLGAVARNRRFWIMVLVSVSINICWHFLVNWIPTYLKKERGLEFETGNFLSSIPFVASGGGNLLGGWLVRRLAASGWSAVRARKVVMALATLLIMAGLGVGLAANHAIAVTLIAIMAAGTAAFIANFFAFSQDVSTRHTGLVVGYLGGIGNLFVAGFQPLAGKLEDLTGSFAVVFVIVGLAPLIGLAALIWGWDDRKGEGEAVDEHVG
jgi:cyanate permease